MVALELPSETLSIENREALFFELYQEMFPAVARFVKNQNGSLQDAKDIFQDSLIIFYEKSVGNKVEINVSREAYIMGIAKNLWLRKFNNDVVRSSITEAESLIEIPDGFYNEINESKLLNFLALAGNKCLEILTDFYYHHMSMNSVMKKFGFASQHSATVQKFKCLEKVRDIVKAKSQSYEDFLE